MKQLFKILNLVLCLELIIGPFAPGVNFFTSQKALAEDCPSGFQYDGTLNRCITSDQVATVMNAVAACGEDKACYKRNAEEALKAAEQEGKVQKQIENKSGLFNTGMKAGAVAVPLALGAGMFLKGRRNGQSCMSTSLYAMMGAGVALFAGDFWANRQHKGRLKDIEKEWNEIVNPKDATTSTATTATTENSDVKKAKATEGQSQAFEMLAKSEDSMAAAAKFKTGVYGVATAAFAASAVLSTLEMISLNKLKAAMIAAPDPASKSAATTAYNAAYKKSHCTNVVPATPAATVYHDIQKLKLIPLLKDAKDFASFITLQNSINDEMNFSSPSLESFESNKNLYSSNEISNSPEVFNLIKYVAIKVLTEVSIIPSAVAQDHTPIDPSLQGLNEVDPSANAGAAQVTEANNPAMQQLNKINNFLFSPMGRAAIAGVFAGWSGIMTLHSMKQAKVSKARAEHLRKIKDSFNDATGAIGCSTAERADASNGNCYCYTSDGKRNSARASTPICTALFSGKNLTAGNYTNPTTGSQLVCITTAGAIDEACACKATKTCSNTMPSNITGVSPGSLSLLSSGLTPVDQLANGNLAAAQVNGSASIGNAMNLLDANDKLEDQLKDKNLDSKQKDIAKQVEGALITAGAGSSNGLANSGAMPSNPLQAAAALEEELKRNTNQVNTYSSGAGMNQPGSSHNEAPLEFGLTPQDFSAQQTELVEVMGKNIDYGQNDISSSGSDTNIFQVLSNRYQRSGMRRLFDAEGKTKADKPKASDISE